MRPPVRRGGYFKARSSAWMKAHTEARWTPESPAPKWWAELDAAWQIDAGILPSIRDFAEFLGWKKSTLEGLLKEVFGDVERWSDKSRTNPGQQSDTSRTEAGQSDKVQGQQLIESSDESRTDFGQSPDAPCAPAPLSNLNSRLQTEIRSEVCPSAIPVQTPQVHLFPPIGQAPAEPLQAPALAQTPPPAPEAPIKHPGPVSGASQSKPAAPKESTGDAERVWKAWRKIRKGCREEIPQDAKKAMSAALKGNTAEEIEGVIGWVHLGSHDRARFLRGGADPGECNAAKAYGLVTVLRHMGEYLELAKAEGQSSGPIILDADGNVEAPKPQKAAPNRGNSIDSAASTYELAQLLRAEEAKHGFGP